MVSGSLYLTSFIDAESPVVWAMGSSSKGDDDLWDKEELLGAWSLLGGTQAQLDGDQSWPGGPWSWRG